MSAEATIDQETQNAIDIDRAKGDFHFPENHKYDAGVGLSTDTINYISDVKNDPDWVRAYRLKAYETFLSKPMPTNWATEDLNNIHFDDIRYYLADGQKPMRNWEDVPAEVL